MRMKHLQDKRAALVAESKALAANTEWTAEQSARAKAMPGEIAEIDAELTALRAMEDADKATRDTVPGALDTRGRIEVGEDREAVKPFHSLGEQLIAIRNAEVSRGTQIDKRLLRAATGSSAGTNTDGGYLVQSDISTEIMKRAITTGAVSSRCRRLSVEGNGIKFYAVDDDSRSGGQVYGGILAYWAGEADTVTAKKPKLKEVEAKLNKLMGLWYQTDELAQDAAALTGIARDGFGLAMNYALENAIYNGTGVGQPLGIMNSGALVSVAKETNQAAATIVYDNVRKMKTRLDPASRSKGTILINPDCEEQLETMVMPIGTGGVAVYMPAGGISQTGYSSLYGMPVIPNDYSPALGTVGDILMADLSNYLIIDKGGIDEQMSMHVRFVYGENVFRWTWRVGGLPLVNSAVTLPNSSNTRSPFVALATRA